LSLECNSDGVMAGEIGESTILVDAKTLYHRALLTGENEVVGAGRDASQFVRWVRHVKLTDVGRHSLSQSVTAQRSSD